MHAVEPKTVKMKRLGDAGLVGCQCVSGNNSPLLWALRFHVHFLCVVVVESWWGASK